MAPASVGGGERLRALDKSRFSCFPFEDFAILWVVNDKGEILIALEEGILAEQDGGSISFPLPKNLASAYSKLGQCSLLGHVFISAVEGRPLREIIGDIQRREGRMDAGEFLFNATAFKKSQVGSDLAGRISAQLLQTATKKQ
jgi:hypothetical protein